MSRPLELTAQADQSLAAGDRAGAIVLLERAVASGPDFDSWMKLAALRRAAGKTEAALDAVNAALTFDPLDFAALLGRAMLIDRLSKEGAGEEFVQALAQRPANGVPPAMRASVAYAEAKAAAHIEARDARLQSALALVEASEAECARIDRFRSNALRQTWAHHSDPTHYHFPGLAEHEFHDRAAFPWIEALEAAAPDILAEFEALVRSERAELVPYLRYADHEPIGAVRALNRSRVWTAIHLWEDGRLVETNASQCPRTLAALEQVGQPRVPGMSPSAMFSLLAPGTHIPPHTGVANTRLICHLPLIVPEGCWFRVGAETRPWVSGQAFVFDDTIEHEAMNPSDAMRAVLIFDLWHPGLAVSERLAATTVMASGPQDIAFGVKQPPATAG